MWVLEADPSICNLKISKILWNTLMQGVWEKDEIRKDDSFLTFEEIFDVAKKEKVCSLIRWPESIIQ
jgi:hypothetical protein